MIPENSSQLMTLKEAARELRLSVSTLKRYIYAGQLRTYRTPGGRHRVGRADLAALMVAAPPIPVTETAAPERPDAFAGEVVERVGRGLGRRLARLEMEVERLGYSLDAISAALRRPAIPSPETIPVAPSPGGCQIRVLGPGCRACDRLTALVEEIARVLGIGSESVSRVKEIDQIAEYGPTPLPALVVNNQLVSAGRLPSRSRLTELLRRCLSN